MELDISVKSEKNESCGCGDAPAPDGQCCRAETETPCKRQQEKGPDRRKDRVERRVGMERRGQSADQAGYTGPDRRANDERRTGLERRRGPGRRLSDDRKLAEEGEMTGYQFEFVMAIQTYKKVNKKMYPTWTEILEIVQQLGYRKVAPRTIRMDSPEPPMMKVA